MSLEQSILEVVRSLTPEKQREILDHANRLRGPGGPKRPFKSVKELWADLNISLSAEEIEEARHEAWKSFPREHL